MKKDIVAGLGEIGIPILKLISKNENAIGFDLDKKLMNLKKFQRYQNTDTLFLHICIPFSKKFITNVLKLTEKFDPEIVVIHSTISPHTTSTLQSKLKIPVIYSATRGIHKRMIYDLKRYTKFFAISPKAPKKKFAINEFKKIMKQVGVKTKQMSIPETLELGKIDKKQVKVYHNSIDKNGNVEAPDKPGLGVTLDWDWINKFETDRGIIAEK